MNKKVKGLSVALCGLVLMAGLSVTNVKAASSVKNVQAVSYEQIRPMFGAMLSEDFRSDGTVQNAHITFRPISGAVKYSCEYRDDGRGYTYNFTSNDNEARTGKIYVPIPKSNGANYVATLTAYDSSGRVIRTETYGYDYENGNITLYLVSRDA